MLTRLKPCHGIPRIVVLALSLFLVAGCNKKSSEDYIHSAQAHRAAGNISAAIIDLKNALQLQPKNETARLLLARFYLDLPDPTSAEGELLRAQQDGVAATKFAEPLAEAELMLGRPAKALKETELANADTPALKASLLGMRAQALMALGKMTEARSVLDGALKAAPHSVVALTAMTRYSLATNDVDTARKYLGEAQKEEPKNATLFSLQGGIAFASGKYEAAEQAYKLMQKSAPWSLSARISLARAQIAQNKQKEADSNIAFVLKKAPNNPIANYVAAVVSYREGHYSDAQTRIQHTLSNTNGFAPAILLAGATSYALKQYEQANSYLNHYVYLAPRNVAARKLLAATQEALGHSSEAVKTLLPAVDQAKDDAQLLAMIGEASARSGNLSAAGKYLALAVEKQPENAALRTQLGITRVALGETDAGIGDLERATKQDPSSLRPETALFLTYMRNKEFDKALDVAQRLVKAHPKEAAGYDYRGLAEMAKSNVGAAQKALLHARKLKPGDPIALRALATLAVRDKNFTLANQYYQEILKANPKDVQAYFALATLEQRAGHADQVKPILERAVSQNPNNPAARLILARFLLLERKYKEALNAVQPALGKSPRDPALLEVAGRAQLGAKNAAAAVESFRTLTQVKPNAGVAHRYLAEAYVAAGKLDQALPEAKKAADLDKHDLGARILLTRIYMTKHRYDDANKLATELASTYPKNAGVAEIQGMLAMAEGRPQDAIAAYRRGLSIADNNFFRSRLATAEARSGHVDQAEKTLLPWIKEHPDDAVARLAMGDIYVAADRPADAEVQYAAILKKSPNNALAENNLAWALSQLGKNAEALEHAQHAASLAPRSSQVLDTLGVVLMKNGKADEAVTALKKAVGNGASASPQIRFHLAQALAAAGKKADARDDLRAVLSTGKPFKERDDAQKLLKELGG